MSMTNAVAIKELLGGSFAPADDALLTKLATAANAFVIGYLGYDPILTTFTEVKDGTGTERMSLDVLNVKSIVSLKIDNVAIPAREPQRMSGYTLNKKDGIVSLYGYSFNRGYDNIEIIYTAGFDAYPADLAMAATELAALRWKVKQNIGIQSKTLANETIVFSDKDMNAYTRSTLNEYVKRYLPA